MVTVSGVIATTVSVLFVAETARVRRCAAPLTLRYSWGWLQFASVSVVGSTSLRLAGDGVASGWLSFAQFLTLVLLLSPAVSTLGARKPGVSAWQFFVVAPMIAVLLWPACTHLVNSRGLEPIAMGVPGLAGIIVVILMSSGTCLGTSMTIPGVLYFFGLLSLILAASGMAAVDSFIPMLCPFFLFLSVFIARRMLRIRESEAEQATSPFAAMDATWLLYQDLFGLVWARRVLDRVNLFAIREKWECRLTLQGFRDLDGNAPHQNELERTRDAFRWVLSRFADEDWIDQRLFRLG